MLFTDQKIESYIHNHITPENKVLADLNRETHLNVLQSRMLSGHLQGKILEMISCMVQPENILEIGTFTGYSAICFAKGLKEGGKIITIEVNDEMEDFAKEYFLKTEYSDKIDMLIGDACKIIPTLNKEFDLVFIDADKKQYINYFTLVLPLVKTGGVILADNVLWDGKVVDKKQFNDPDTRAIIEFNEMVVNHEQVENVIIPVRDGINLIRKIK